MLGRGISWLIIRRVTTGFGVMAEDKPNFNLDYGLSSDDESTFSTQTPKENPCDGDNLLDKYVSDLDIEGLMDMTDNSAIGIVASVVGSDTKNSRKFEKEPLNTVQIDSP